VISAQESHAIKDKIIIVIIIIVIFHKFYQEQQ